ncbi:MAG: helix-turn-helix domain-containing protein [Pseudomonadota bacterium]
MTQKPATQDSAMSRRELRREREREFRYTTILAAAETLFATKGFQKTSVDEIADHAEVSVGTLYFYFKNKEALLVDLFDKALFQLRSILGKVFETADTPVKGMEMAGQAFFDEFCTLHREKALILFREAPGHGKRMEARRKRMSELLSSDLIRAIERLRQEAGCTFRNPDSAAVFSMCILGVYEKVAYHFLTEPDDHDRRRMTALDAVAFILGGIKDITRQD